MSDNEHTVETDIDLDAADAVERLVMDIKRRGPGRALPAPDSSAVAAFLAHVAAEEPMSEAEHQERLWQAVDAAVESHDVRERSVAFTLESASGSVPALAEPKSLQEVVYVAADEHARHVMGEMADCR